MGVPNHELGSRNASTCTCISGYASACTCTCVCMHRKRIKPMTTRTNPMTNGCRLRHSCMHSETPNRPIFTMETVPRLQVRVVQRRWKGSQKSYTVRALKPSGRSMRIGKTTRILWPSASFQAPKTNTARHRLEHNMSSSSDTASNGPRARGGYSLPCTWKPNGQLICLGAQVA